MKFGTNASTRLNSAIALALIAATSLLSACGNGKDKNSDSTSTAEESIDEGGIVESPTGSTLSLTAADQTIGLNESTALYAEGGTAPYTYSLATGVGSVTGNVYTSGAVIGNATIQVIDALGNVAYITISVTSNLTLTASSSVISANGTVLLTAVGGMGPYVYSVVSGGGSIAGSIYTAPATATTARLKVTDANGTEAFVSVAVKVYAPVTLTPATSVLYTGDSIQLTAGGGAGGYVFSVVSGGGSFSASTYTAPATASAVTVMATDSMGNSATASIQVIVKVTLNKTVGFEVDDSALLIFNMPKSLASKRPSFVIGGASADYLFGHNVTSSSKTKLAAAPASAAITLTNYNPADPYPYTGALVVVGRSVTQKYAFCIDPRYGVAFLKKATLSVKARTEIENRAIKFDAFATGASSGRVLQALWLEQIDTKSAEGNATLQISAAGHDHRLSDCTGFSDFEISSASNN